MTRRLALCALSLAVGGCAFTIRLDPGSEDAAVYVNGELEGHGTIRHEVESQVGFPESFSVRVVPASGSGQPYSVTVAREFAAVPALYGFGQSLITGGAFLASQYFLKKDEIDRNPEAWMVPMFSGFTLGTLGATIVIAAPLNLLQAFRYREYYDLEEARPDQAQPPSQM